MSKVRVFPGYVTNCKQLPRKGKTRITPCKRSAAWGKKKSTLCFWNPEASLTPLDSLSLSSFRAFILRAFSRDKTYNP